MASLKKCPFLVNFPRKKVYLQCMETSRLVPRSDPTYMSVGSYLGFRVLAIFLTALSVSETKWVDVLFVQSDIEFCEL